MKRYQLVIAISIIIYSFAIWADNCDSGCWQKRYYALQRQQLSNQQKQFDAMMKEKEALRKENEALIKEKKEREKAENRLKLLNEIQARCAKEDLNQASFEEKSLCSVINSHFAYGRAVPDEMLGLK